MDGNILSAEKVLFKISFNQHLEQLINLFMRSVLIPEALNNIVKPYYIWIGKNDKKTIGSISF